MKKCELCKSVAKTFCESDQASLCWSCDAKVHGANFLVARHSRTLLCHFCQSLTPWQAAGPQLGHTVSFCLRCADGDTNEARQGEEAEDDTGSEESELDEEEEEDDEEEEEEEEDGDNQVVPWSASATTPPPASSSSSSSSSESDGCGGESVESRNTVFAKRTRKSPSDLPYLFQDIIDTSSDSQKYGRSPLTTGSRPVEATLLGDSMRPLKNRRIESAILGTGARSTAAIVESLRSLDAIDHNRVRISGGETAAVDDGDEEVRSDSINRTI